MSEGDAIETAPTIALIGAGGGAASGGKSSIGFGGSVGYTGYMSVDLYGLARGRGCIGRAEVTVLGCGTVVVV